MFDNQTFNNQRNTAEAPARKVVRYDSTYLKSMSGILKLVEILCNIVGFICIKVSFSWISSIFYNILYWVGNIITVFLLLMYTFHIVEKYDKWPWTKFEFFYCVAISLGYICTSIFALTIGDSAGYAVGFFGLCAIIAYGLDGYLKYKAWRRGLPPQ